MKIVRNLIELMHIQPEPQKLTHAIVHVQHKGWRIHKAFPKIIPFLESGLQSTYF